MPFLIALLFVTSIHGFERNAAAKNGPGGDDNQRLNHCVKALDNQSLAKKQTNAILDKQKLAFLPSFF